MSVRSAAGGVLFLSAIASPALGQALGDPIAGERVAAANCSQCHGEVDAPGGAPALATIANEPNATEDALSAFLVTPHATMPRIELSLEERRDLIAYILSLRP